MICYYLLCKEFPFYSKDNNEIIRQILQCHPKFPSHIPEKPKRFVLEMLNKDPKKRPKIEEILLNEWLLEKNPTLLNLRRANLSGIQKFAAYTATDIRKLDSSKCEDSKLDKL